MLAVELLQREVARVCRSGDGPDFSPLPVVPLFETLDDLERAATRQLAELVCKETSETIIYGEEAAPEDTKRFGGGGGRDGAPEEEAADADGDNRLDFDEFCEGLARVAARKYGDVAEMSTTQGLEGVILQLLGQVATSAAWQARQAAVASPKLCRSRAWFRGDKQCGESEHPASAFSTTYAP